WKPGLVKRETDTVRSNVGERREAIWSSYDPLSSSPAQPHARLWRFKPRRLHAADQCQRGFFADAVGTLDAEDDEDGAELVGAPLDGVTPVDGTGAVCTYPAFDGEPPVADVSATGSVVLG